MGWSGGTEIFDSMVDIALRYAPKNNTDEGARVSEKTYRAIVADAYQAMADSDWDTMDESKHFNPFLLEVMHDIGEIDDETYNEYE